MSMLHHSTPSNPLRRSSSQTPVSLSFSKKKGEKQGIREDKWAVEKSQSTDFWKHNYRMSEVFPSISQVAEAQSFHTVIHKSTVRSVITIAQIRPPQAHS